MIRGFLADLRVMSIGLSRERESGVRKKKRRPDSLQLPRHDYNGLSF